MSEHTIQRMSRECLQLYRERDELRAQLAVCRAALAPFAALAVAPEGAPDDTDLRSVRFVVPGGDLPLTLGDCRRAAEAVKR